MPGTDVTSKNISVFTQPLGPAPANALQIAGLDGQHVAVGGLTRAVADVKPDFGYDPLLPGQYEARAALYSPPGDFDTFELTAGELTGKVPAALAREGYPFNMYFNEVGCLTPTDPLAFSSYVEIASDCVISANDGGDRKMRADDAVLLDKLTIKARGGLYAVGALIFAEQQPSSVVAAATFGARFGACAVPGAEKKDIYLGIAAQGATVPKVRYSTDGGLTFTDLAVTGILATEAILAIGVVNNQLVLVTDKAGSATQSGYYVSDIDQDTGVPSATWTKVTAGIAATDLLTDAWVEQGALYLVAQKGWIYKTTTPLTGVTTMRQGAAALANITRIRGRNNVLAATLSDGTVLISVDGGVVWAAAATIAVASPLAVGVVDARRIYVGAASGVLKYTDNGGKTWSTVAYAGSGSGTVNDIWVVTPEVIHLAVTISSVGYVVSTWHGFAKSTRTENRVKNLTTNNGLSRLAAPRYGSLFTRANVLVAGGTATGGTLGSLQLGAAPSI